MVKNRLVICYAALTILLGPVFSSVALARHGSACESLFSPFVKFLSFPNLPNKPTKSERQAYEDFLRQSYQYDSSDSFDWLQTEFGLLPAILKGQKYQTRNNQELDLRRAKWDHKFPQTDIAVVGGGIAGLNLAFYAAKLSKEAGKKINILVIENSEKLGGIANWSDRGGITYAEGGAYFTPPEGHWLKIAQDIGLMDKIPKLKIHEWIDSLRHNGKFVPGIWENPEAMAKMLEADFSAFLYCLKKLNEAGEIYIQPISKGKNIRIYDNMSMRDWMLTIPEQLRLMAAAGDTKASEILNRLQADQNQLDVDSLWGRVQTSVTDRVQVRNVNKLLELYGRSAAGDHPDKVNAATFLNFYISEVGIRFTGEEGSGAVTKQLIEAINPYRDQISFYTSSEVVKVIPQKDGSSIVYFLRDNQLFKTRVNRVGFSSQLKHVPSLVKGFNKNSAPEKFTAIQQLEYRHYLVINLHLQGHPLKQVIRKLIIDPLTYDIWVRDDKDYDQRQPTDLIDGRYMHFEGKPEEKRDDNRGVVEVYLPLSAEISKTPLTKAKILEMTKLAIPIAVKHIDDMNGPQNVKVVAAQINVWPDSIHITSLGHFERMATFYMPYRGIFFAHSNIDTPSVESALTTGLFAAEGILKSLGYDVKLSLPDSDPTATESNRR